MKALIIAVVFLMGVLLTRADDKGSCPGLAPKPSKAPENHDPAPKPPSPGAQLTVIPVFVVVSDTGYVCSAEVIGKPDKEVAEKAVEAVKKWKFNPAKKDGRAIPVTVVVRVNFWRNADGEFVHIPDGSNGSPTKANN